MTMNNNPYQKMSTEPIDVIFLQDLIRNIDIGIHGHEIGNPQRLNFDIYAELKIHEGSYEDDIHKVLNYEYLVESIDSVISKKRFFLLETLGKALMDEILKPYQVISATIFISKLDILDSGRIGYSMTRTK